MSKFWQHLAQLSQAQLFHGGYLSPEVVATLEKRRGKKIAKRSAEKQPQQIRWPRLAIPH